MLRNFLLASLIFSIFGIGTSNAKDTVSAADINLEIGEPGLSYKYEATMGVTGEPYIVDTEHLNRPTGLFVDNSNNVFVIEEAGYRLLKYSPSGSNLLTIGRAGINYTDDYVFNDPKDITVDGDGNIWVADTNRVVKYDVTGNFLQNYPADNPYDSGSSSERFDFVRGIAVHENNLFVSDSNNHCIQIFDISSGSPIFSATIGETGIPGNDNTHFNYPGRITIDTNGILYVVDIDNNRVQQCTNSGSWNCLTYVDNLNYPQGIDVHGTDVYVTNTDNLEILKCSAIGNCTKFNQDYSEIHDVAIDSSGIVYGSFSRESIIIKYDTDGSILETFIGQPNIPYLTNTNHFNAPRVYIDSSENIIIIEEKGQRLLKFDPQGNFLWSVGTAGMTSDDNEHFNNPHAVATDSKDNIYVADSYRVQIFDPDGNYKDTIIDVGDTPFDWITGVAVDADGNVFVSDAPKHVIKIFDSNLNFIEQIGVLNECGSDNEHFCWPIGIDTDKYGNLYVADAGNARFQKLDKDQEWVMTLGTTGSWGDSFSEFDSPEDVAIDTSGRILTAEMWSNKRIQVFSTSGEYLTTIGGDFGESSSDFYAISSVAVNSKDKVYITDYQLGRIQIFSPGIPDWVQVNINGFGSRETSWVSALENYNGKLYAGTGNMNEGGQIWESTNGTDWLAVSEPAFGADDGIIIMDMIEFKDQLYVSLGWFENNPAKIYRTSSPGIWEQVVEDGFDLTNNTSVSRFVVFGDYLYAATIDQTDGLSIWRSSSGNKNSWERVVTNGFGDSGNNITTTFMEFDGYLYAGTEKFDEGAEIWRTNNGTSWEQVNIDGFGYPNNIHIGSIVVFNNTLYASTRNDPEGSEIWSSTNGMNWYKEIDSGIDDSNNYKIESLYVHNNQLFATANNWITGLNTWESTDGNTFSQINLSGFGDSNNETTLWNSATTVFNDQLYIGTTNYANGGELWRYEKSGSNIYLPLILNNYKAPLENTWNKFASPTTQTLNAVKMLTADSGWSVGNAGTILRWNGSNWSDISSPTMSNLNDLSLLNTNNIWAVGDSGTILKWNGTIWQSYTSPTTSNLNGIHFLNANNGWIVGESGIILRWDGSIWNIWTSPTTYDLFALDFLSDTDGWAVGGVSGYGTASSEILMWNGTEWTIYEHEVSLQAADVLYDIDMVSSIFGIALGMNNNGEMWNGYYWNWYNPNPYLMRHQGVDFLSVSDGWSVGWIYEESNILNWNGNEWSRVSCPVDSELMDVYMLDSDHGWIVGAEGVILRYGN